MKDPLKLNKAYEIITAFKKEEETPTIIELIKRVDISIAHAHKLIDELAEHKYIKKRISTTRTRPIRLTEKGKETYKIAKKLMEKITQ